MFPSFSGCRHASQQNTIPGPVSLPFPSPRQYNETAFSLPPSQGHCPLGLSSSVPCVGLPGGEELIKSGMYGHVFNYCIY